jgi:membrane associated rhomboid family serine protease
MDQVCFIHPDRPTRVTCSNCGRPICPDDMTPAPVGYQCPICTGRMREGAGAVARTTYRTRSEVSRQADRVPLLRLVRGASVTQLVIGAKVLMLLLMFATGRPTAGSTLLRFGALPPVLPRSDWWRMVTAMFVHIGPLHLLFNTWALMLFGPALEQRYGRMRFLFLYLAAGVLGSAFSLAFTAGGIRAGASGGVFGIMGGWLAFFLTHRDVPSLRGQLRSIVFLIGINIVFSVTFPGIDTWAHIGGLAGGFVIGAVLELSATRLRGNARRHAWLVALAAVIAVASILSLPHMV